jgi:IS30 family transposase
LLNGSGVNREIPAPFYERLAGKFRRSTHQISGYAKKHELFSISHERIYQFVLKDKKEGGKLYRHLRHQSRKYKKRYGCLNNRGPIKNRVFIDDRPKVVDAKERVGDWEIYTIIGKNRQKAIVTMVERVTKKCVCKKVENKKSKVVTKEIIDSLKPLSKFVLTITGDNVLTFKSITIFGKKLLLAIMLIKNFYSLQNASGFHLN